MRARFCGLFADDGPAVVAALEERGVRCLALGSRVRLVTHLDVDRAGIQRACKALREVL